ncbi:3-deoxy-8-phosphooctulonate synthase [Simkania sp.]|uniref:3-deoxy-8-phosphooctulonate synthase n=1 Tax=Simkania sp. TaxID=34094 RepID=UPI003B51762A
MKIRNVKLSSDAPLVVISGPCVIENEAHALETAGQLKEMFEEAGVQLIYKSSYDKANRSSIDSYRGPGLEEGLRILQKVKETFDVPVFTDIHHPEEVTAAAEVCDVLQIPAFLCRQTDLLIAAGNSGAVINIKKGQFMAPWDMEHAVKKILSTGNDQILLTDRGTSFGYNNLVSDMRAIPIMKKFGFPVCYDASHSVQLPGGMGEQSGGNREFIIPLAKAALAAGADLLYIESHPNPAEAKSDKHSVMPFEDLKKFLQIAKPLHELLNAREVLC